nr:hypothetical protein [Geodermatophilus saharensis]
MLTSGFSRLVRLRGIAGGSSGRSVVAGCRGGGREGLLECGRHGVRRGARGVLGQVAVGVDRDADRGVPQHLRHDRHRDAGGEHQRRRAVAEVMQPDLAQARGLSQGDEATGDVLRPQRGAVLPGEHQVVRLVGVAPALPIEVLAESDLQQRLDGALGQRHGRLRRPGLGRRELQAAADVDHGLPDPCGAVGEVQVGPPQAQRLTATETAGGDDLEQRAEAVGLGVPEKRSELGRGPRAHLGPGTVRRGDVARDVERQPSGPHAVAERGPERRVDPPDGDRPAAVRSVDEQLLDVLGAQLLDRDVADGRDYDALDVRSVGAERCRFGLAGLHLQPAGQEGRDGLTVVHAHALGCAVGDVGQCPVRRGLGREAPAAHGAALAGGGRHVHGEVPGAVLPVGGQPGARLPQLFAGSVAAGAAAVDAAAAVAVHRSPRA